MSHGFVCIFLLYVFKIRYQHICWRNILGNRDKPNLEAEEDTTILENICKGVVEDSNEENGKFHEPRREV